MNLRKSVLALALASVAIQASAHRGWLYPQETNVAAKEAWVTIDGAISEGLFEVDHVALKLDGATVPDPERHQETLEEITRRVRRFGIQHVTVQLERTPDCC